MLIKAKLNYLRISPRKVRQIARAIKGLEITRAEAYLTNISNKPALPLLKLLKSAAANAHNNFNIDHKVRLFVHNIKVDEGPTLKRWRPRAFGRAYTIRKRTSHVTLEIKIEKEIGSKKKKSATRDKSQPEIKISSEKFANQPDRKKPKIALQDRKRNLNRFEKSKRGFFQRKSFN